MYNFSRQKKKQVSEIQRAETCQMENSERVQSCDAWFTVAACDKWTQVLKLELFSKMILQPPDKELAPSPNTVARSKVSVLCTVKNLQEQYISEKTQKLWLKEELNIDFITLFRNVFT